MIGSLYTKVFGNHDATDVMNLEGVSLDQMLKLNREMMMI
jgi:hypothetical protein